MQYKLKISIIYFLIIILFHPKNGICQNISTFAGNGSSYFSGDGMPATSAGIPIPRGGIFNKYGEYIFADGGANRIRKIDMDGIITTVAGIGIGGFDGDGNLATDAKLNGPSSVAIDTSGNLIVVDAENFRLRKIDAMTNIITTIAGVGIGGYGGDGGAATNAMFWGISDICIDYESNIYIADGVNSRVRKINKDGVITTFAGNGVVGFTGDGGYATQARLGIPSGLSVDLNGNILIADASGLVNRVRKVNQLGIISTIAGNGIGTYIDDSIPATAAQISPSRVTSFSLNNIVISDRYNNRVYEIDSVGYLYCIAGNGVAGDNGDGGQAIFAELNSPVGIAFDLCGNLYVSCLGNSSVPGSGRRIRKVTYNPPPCTYLGTQPMVSAAQLTLTPNPTTSTLTITSPTTIANIALHNAVGQVVLWQRAATREAVLDVAALPAGVYVVRVTDANGAVTVRRVVKE